MVGVSEDPDFSRAHRPIRMAWRRWIGANDKDGTRFIDENMNLPDEYYDIKDAFYAGYKQGEELDMNRNLAEINGGLEGRKLDMNEQSDMVSVNSEDTIEARAHLAWYKWTRESNIDPNTADPETYELMKDAFIDGYLNGFTKRITG